MKKIAILLVVICCTMCKQKPETNQTIFVDMDHPEKASLFDYFRSIELIPLETSPDVLIAYVHKIIVHGDRYFTFDKRQDIIHVFDQTGKFLFKIDKKGRGPGEYSHIEDININPFSGHLELLEAYGSVHIFDLSGNYIETKRITYPDFYAVHHFAAVDSHTHVFYAMFQPKKIIYFNLDDHKLLREEFEEMEDIGKFGINSLYSYQDDLYFFRPFHPVVYKVGKERLEPAFQFDFEKYTREGTTAIFSEESRNRWSKYVEEVFEQFSYVINTVRHNSKYVFASLLWKDIDRRANIIYDKSTGKSRFILDFTEKVVFNAYRGEEIIITDEYVLMPCFWVDLEERITKEMLDDRQKEIFEELLQAKMELNPILIKYWFK